MSKKANERLFCPAPQVVRDFCLEELYPQFLFRYLAPRMPNPDVLELQLCGLVYTQTPSRFIAQLDADRRTADRISHNLSMLYETDQQRARFTIGDEFLHPGVPVAARYTQDGDLRWYRAIIVEIDNTLNKENPIQIRFVDYGNYQQVTRNQIKLMPIDMGSDPPLAIKCRLKGTEEDEEFDRPLISNFLGWINHSLKDRRALVNFCAFDAAANQHLVRLYNSENGEEFLLPPEGRRPRQRPTEVPIVDNLIKLDEDVCVEVQKKGSVADLVGSTSTSAAQSTPAPVPSSAFVEQLREVFESGFGEPQGASASVDVPAQGISCRPETEVDHKETQTDLCLIKPAAGGESEYDPFIDPKYQSLIAKYPNIFKYLNFPDDLPGAE